MVLLAKALLLALLAAPLPKPWPPGPSPDGLVFQRIRSFDANDDRLIGADELPERLRPLVAEGDINGDARLQDCEITMLIAARTERRNKELRQAGRSGPAAEPARRAPPPRGPTGVVLDLKLPEPTRGRALALIASHATAFARGAATMADLHAGMRRILSPEQYEDFAAALVRPSGPVGGVVGRRINGFSDPVQLCTF